MLSAGTKLMSSGSHNNRAIKCLTGTFADTKSTRTTRATAAFCITLLQAKKKNWDFIIVIIEIASV